jgi:predicted amidohydrolase YtcJ
VLGTTDLFSRVLACGLGNGFTLGFEHMEACPSWAAAHVAALQVAGTRVEVCSQPGFNDDLAAYTDRLPQDVLAMINPYREFKRRGLKWTFGTDGPITGDRTFGAFAQAINRPGGQAIEVADMFGAAIDGHLEVGRPFTAISLDRDSFADPSGMADTTVLETRIGGRVVWSKAA